MSNLPETPPPEWDLGDWERTLTIEVGSAYACRDCENLVMVTRGGVGIMQLICCGSPMQKVGPARAREDEDQ
ncbi:MAG: hypothetical protein ACYS8K_07005 [Planctomycetota bacterium]|jgi:hypothetical protein